MSTRYKSKFYVTKVVKMYNVTTYGLVICHQHFGATFRPRLQGTTELPTLW